MAVIRTRLYTAVSRNLGVLRLLVRKDKGDGWRGQNDLSQSGAGVPAVRGRLPRNATNGYNPQNRPQNYFRPGCRVGYYIRVFAKSDATVSATALQQSFDELGWDAVIECSAGKED